MIEQENSNKKKLTGVNRVITLLWLSFTTAAIATGVFFSTIDPEALRSCVNFPEISRMGAYSVGFLLFWLLTSMTALLADRTLNPNK